MLSNKYSKICREQKSKKMVYKIKIDDGVCMCGRIAKKKKKKRKKNIDRNKKHEGLKL